MNLCKMVFSLHVPIVEWGILCVPVIHQKVGEIPSFDAADE